MLLKNKLECFDPNNIFDTCLIFESKLYL